MRKILFVFDNDRYKNFEQKIVNQVRHGYNKVQVEFVYTCYENNLIRKVRNFRFVGSLLQHFFYWLKALSYVFECMKSNADTIYCINPLVAIFCGLFNRKKKIFMCGFLFEPKSNKMYYRLRLLFTKIALRGIYRAVVYGKREVAYYNKLFNNDKFVFVQYGIDFDNGQAYVGSKMPKEYIFSGGGSNRDYATLIGAYNKSKKYYPLVIATQPWRLSGFDLNKTILLSDVILENFGDVLLRAKILILSLKNSEISAGHMVLFQAMALGVPVLVNDIPAIRDYADENLVEYYESGNVDSLKKKIDSIEKNMDQYNTKAFKAKEYYRNHLTFVSFVQRLLMLSKNY